MVTSSPRLNLAGGAFSALATIHSGDSSGSLSMALACFFSHQIDPAIE
jgi:hypothetical protein